MRKAELLARRRSERNRETPQGIAVRPLVVQILLCLPGLARFKALMGAAPKPAVIPASPTRLEPGDILTPQELAQRLKVRVRFLYEVAARENNPLPCLHCGRYLRFCWPDVCAWLRSNNSA